MHWTSFSIALTSATLALATPAVAQTPLAPGEIARVGDQPILKTEFDHWMTIVSDGGRDEEAQQRVMQLLVSLRWLEGEAKLHRIVIPTRRVNARYRRQKRASFLNERQFQRWLRTSGQTVADLKLRVRQEMLSDRLRKHAVGDAKTARWQQRRLDRFVTEFFARWKAVTVCGEGYANEQDCGTVVPGST